MKLRKERIYLLEKRLQMVHGECRSREDLLRERLGPDLTKPQTGVRNKPRARVAPSKAAKSLQEQRSRLEATIQIKTNICTLREGELHELEQEVAAKRGQLRQMVRGLDDFKPSRQLSRLLRRHDIL
jgi:hypothetical protein